MTLRRIRSFRVPGEPVVANELAQQLAKLEENVAQEATDIRAGYQARLHPVATEKRTSDLLISPGQSVSIDTSTGNVSVTLTRPVPGDSGKFIALAKVFAANTLTVLVQTGTTVNRAVSTTKASVGLLLIYCDGVEYWA